MRRDLKRRLRAAEATGLGGIEIWAERGDDIVRSQHGEPLTRNKAECSSERSPLMRRALTSRLAKAEILHPVISWADRQAAHHRQSLRAGVKWCEIIRERLRKIGIDPELAVSLRRGARAAVELAAIPDTDELRAADETIVRAEPTYENDAARQVKAKIARMAEQYRGGHYKLDLSNASPAELLAILRCS